MTSITSNSSQGTVTTGSLTIVDVDLIPNKDIFAIIPAVENPQNLTDMENAPLLSIKWPKWHEITAITKWVPDITPPNAQRMLDFVQSSLQELTLDGWEMVKRVIQRCLLQFDACLLELTLWEVRLGHKDMRSAQEVKDKAKSVTEILGCLFADTEFLFRDVEIKWDVSAVSMVPDTLFLPDTVSPVQESSTDTKGQQSALSCPASDEPRLYESSKGITEESVGFKDLLERVLQSVASLKGTMDTYHQEMCERLDVIFSGNKYLALDHSSTADIPDDSALALQSSAQVLSSEPHRAGLGELVSSQTDVDLTSRSDTGIWSQTTHGSHRTGSSPARGTVQQEADSGRNASDSRTPLTSSVQQRSAPGAGQTRGTARSMRLSSHSTLMRRDNFSRDRAFESIKEEPSESNNSAHGSRDTGPHSSEHSQASGQRSQSQTAPPSGSARSASTPSPPSAHASSRGRESRSKPKQPQSSAGTASASGSSPHGSGMSSSSGRPDSTKSVSQEEMKIVVVSDVEAQLVKESVDRAYLEDEKKAPKAKSFDTILCLDISDSMNKGGAFEQMKKTALAFIDGVEDVVTESGVEENMGLVVFGERANVVQNLTNDFNLIRDGIDALEPGGTSPFVEALLVSMAAFVRKGGIVSVSGEWEVKPRIVFISDGHPTESTQGSSMDFPNNINNVRLSLSRMLMSFKSSENFNKVHPVIFVPVGGHADKKYMDAMAKICDGQYVEPENIKSLCQYFRVQETIGKVLKCMKRENDSPNEEKIEATVTALTTELGEAERKQILVVVKRELSNPERKRSHHAKPNELDSVIENAAKVDEGSFLPLGTRVVRGPDWEWQDQDGNGPGTVINHHDKHSIHWVHWDTGDYNCYPYSPRRGYHIFKTEDHPRLRVGNEPLEIGMTVRKGKDWVPAQGQEEQGEGRGVIIRKSKNQGKVTVRWSNGVIQICRWSPDGPQDVDYCPPDEEADVRPPPVHVAGASSQPQAASELAPVVFSGDGTWQYLDHNNRWQPYSKQVNQEIEAACKKKNARSCLIEREGKKRRIMFRKMVEKVIDGGVECEVRRVQAA